MYIPPVNNSTFILNNNTKNNNKERFNEAIIEGSTTTHTFVPIEIQKQILNELKNILQTDKIEDSGQISIYDKYISLYDISNLITRERKKYEDLKKQTGKLLEKVFDEYISSDCKCVVYDFDFDDNELIIGFNTSNYLNCDSITFAKINNDLYLKKDNSLYGQDIFNCASDILSDAYDQLIKFKDLFTQSTYDPNLINSKILIYISAYGTNIEVQNPKSVFNPYFSLKIDSEGDIIKNCNSSTVNNLIKNKEREIFKKSFIMINKCPKWMQEELYEIRKNQIIEEKRIEQERLEYEKEARRLKQLEEEKENKKQKRLQFVKKIFPFIQK